MFEEVEHKRTAEENKLLVVEIVVALAICAAIGIGLVWFYGYYGA